MDFFGGGATVANQSEVAYNVDGKGLSVQDCITGRKNFTVTPTEDNRRLVSITLTDMTTGTLERFKKKSLHWYKEVIATNGISLDRTSLINATKNIT